MQKTVKRERRERKREGSSTEKEDGEASEGEGADLQLKDSSSADCWAYGVCGSLVKVKR